MSRSRLITIVATIVVVVTGGVAVWLLWPTDDNPPSSSVDTVVDEPADTNTFRPLATNNQAFVATMTSSGETAFDGTLEHDGSGNTKFTGTTGNDTVTLYHIDNQSISCSNDQCFALPDSRGMVDESQYSYDDAAFESYQSAATFVGNAPCPAGTCAHWLVASEGEETNVYIARDNRVSRISGTRDGQTFTIDYDYRPITITRPANVAEFPMG